MRDVRIFRLINDADTTKGHQERLIITAYSRSGLTVSAWNGYSDEIIGRAHGGGYDKTHTALASAIAKLDPRVGQIAHVGSAGFRAVQEAVAPFGWTIETLA